MRSISVFLAIIVSIVPLATATNWSYRGESEPDSILDDPAYMWFEPDTSPSGHRVYFSGFQKAAPDGDYNANVHLLGSRVLAPVTAATALLGFWKDCNGDGYIGAVESALIEYRVELLIDDGICPPARPSPGQTIYPYNDGTWIREIIWIGPSQLPHAAGAPSGNPTNFYDDGVRVWGDYGLPGGVPTTLCPGGNAGARSVGTIMDHLDCQTYYRVTRTLNGVQADTGLPVGGWDHEDVDNSPSALNVDNPAYYYLYGPEELDGHPEEGDYRGFNGGLFGRDNEAAGTERQRFVTVADCETGSVDQSPEVNTPADATDSSTYPSVYESLNDTFVVVVQGNDCDPQSGSEEGLPYNAFQPEGYSEPTTVGAGRVEVDHAFIFNIGSRNWPAGAFSGTCKPTNFVAGPLGYCPPGDLGTGAARHDFAVGSAWRANTITNIYPIYARESLRSESADFGGWYSTYYAKLGSKVLSVATMPAGNAAKVYGSEACGDNIDGVRNFWNCSAADWQQRCADGETQVGPCYVVGETYNLRDIDCWDNTLVRGTPTQVGLSQLSESGPCQDNPVNAGPDV